MFTSPSAIKCFKIHIYARDHQGDDPLIYDVCRLVKKLLSRAWKFSSKRSQFFTIQTDLKPANNLFIFFPAVNWLYRLQMGWFTQLLSFNGLARRLPTICKKILAENDFSDSRQRKMYQRTDYFMLAAFISLIKFSKIAFGMWNFVQSFLLQK